MRNYTMSDATNRGCGCMPDKSYTKNEFALAMAYVPWQYFTTVYEPDRALEVGTIFPELDKPFLAGGRCARK